MYICLSLCVCIYEYYICLSVCILLRI
jgi:hypothetical protein